MYILRVIAPSDGKVFVKHLSLVSRQHPDRPCYKDVLTPWSAISDEFTISVDFVETEEGAHRSLSKMYMLQVQEALYKHTALRTELLECV